MVRPAEGMGKNKTRWQGRKAQLSKGCAFLMSSAGTALAAFNFRRPDMQDTKELAKQILASGVLDNPNDYSLKDLFCIRDSVNMLLDYFPNEKWLLDLRNETLDYLTQKIGE